MRPTYYQMAFWLFIISRLRDVSTYYNILYKSFTEILFYTLCEYVYDVRMTQWKMHLYEDASPRPWRCSTGDGGRVAAVMSTWAQHIRPRMNVPPRFTYNWWHFNLIQEHNNKTQPFMETCRRTAYRPLVPSPCLFAGPLISRRSALGVFCFQSYPIVYRLLVLLMYMYSLY